MAQISSAESGIFVSYRVPVAWLSFSHQGKTAGKRDSLRLIIADFSRRCYQLVIAAWSKIMVMLRHSSRLPNLNENWFFNRVHSQSDASFVSHNGYCRSALARRLWRDCP